MFCSDLPSTNCVPAPLDYHPNYKVSKRSAPAYTFKSRYTQHNGTGGGENPAPGDYAADIKSNRRGAYVLSTKENVPAVSFTYAQREGLKNGPDNVGPGSYNIGSDSIERTPRAATIAPRYQRPDAQKEIPGPAEYSPHRFRSQQFQFSMAGKYYSKLEAREGFPGPGAYDYHNYAKGPRHSIYERLPQKYDNGVPGPAAYEQPCSFGSADKAKSLNGSDRFKQSTAYTPAANAYVLGTLFDKPKGFTLKSRPQQNCTNDVPAAGHYYPMYTQVERNAKSTKIHEKFKQEPKSDNPGVGAYEVSQAGGGVGRHGPQITIAPRYGETRDKWSIPGPQEYTPKRSQTEKSVPDIRPGVKYSRREEHLKVGPGSYDTARSIAKEYASVLTLHEKHKPAKSLMENPGPGAYAVDRDWKKKRTGGYIAAKTRRAWRTEI